MRKWNLKNGDPLNLVIAADARLCKPDYRNDQIWEITLGRRDPPALEVETSFGMRVARMSLFPVIRCSSRTVIDPASYFASPVFEQILPNYISARCLPVEQLEMFIEYWVPSSQSMAGRLTFKNISTNPLGFLFEWVGIMEPMGVGNKMSAVQQGLTWILTGNSQGLFPVCFLQGGPRPGTGFYPSLALNLSLDPGESRSYRWALSALGSQDESLATSRDLCARDWDAEVSHIVLLNESQMVDISTGNPDWDAALMLAQVASFRLVMPAGEELDEPSSVQNRLPDQGHALRLDCSDYSYLWKGQTALDAWYLSSLLPGMPELAKGFVDNFLHIEKTDGFIDYQPGIAGQHSTIPAQPLLASLALDVFYRTGNLDWLRSIVPSLMKFFFFWFEPAQDRDRDGMPEWSHPIQSGCENLPLFAGDGKHSGGIPINFVESPSLAAMLIHDGQALLQMFEILGLDENRLETESHLDTLIQALESTWDDEGCIYHYRDYQSHLTLPAKELFSRKENGKYAVNFGLPLSQRLCLSAVIKSSQCSGLKVTITGKNKREPVVESIVASHWHRSGSIFSAVTNSLYTQVKKITIDGLKKGEIRISTPDLKLEDLSLLLPIWCSGLLDLKIKKMAGMLHRHWLKAYGIPQSFSKGRKNQPSGSPSVKPVWNQFIGEGLVAYGLRKEAAQLLSRLISAVIINLKSSHSFYSSYDPLSGFGRDERDHLHGLAPLGLFLQIAGIEQLAVDSVIVSSLSAFPLPVVVQYRGMTVTCQKDATKVEFMKGGTYTVKGKDRVKITPQGIQKEGAV